MRDHNKDDGTFTIDIDSFNNKGQKGDDDFETWLENEAPFVREDSTTGTFAESASSYTITNSGSVTTLTDGNIASNSYIIFDISYRTG